MKTLNLFHVNETGDDCSNRYGVEIFEGFRLLSVALGEAICLKESGPMKRAEVVHDTAHQRHRLARLSDCESQINRRIN